VYESWAGEGEPDYEPPNSAVEFPGASIAMPLGQSYEGDWRLEDRITEPTCDVEHPNVIDASLTFENLRVSVSPRKPTRFDELMDELFHRGSLLGDLLQGHLDPPSSATLDCSDTR
jgi:hypothetical protein